MDNEDIARKTRLRIYIENAQREDAARKKKTGERKMRELEAMNRTKRLKEIKEKILVLWGKGMNRKDIAEEVGKSYLVVCRHIALNKKND